MKALVAVATAAILVGCGTAVFPEPSRPAKLTYEQRHWADSWMVSSLQEQTVRNAVLRQHTIFPYHFEGDSAELNAIGKRDLAILAGQFRNHAGRLNVRRDEACDRLFQERVASVRAFLWHEGVPPGNVRIADACAGGDGMDSEQTMEVLRRSREKKTATDTGSSMIGAGNSNENSTSQTNPGKKP